MCRRTFVYIGVLMMFGCKGSTPVESNAGLRVGMIPSTDPGKIVRQSQPLTDYLRKETGANIELFVPTNYAAVVEAIANDKVDIAYLGGFTYVQASARAGVQPLVQRESDQNFHSVLITQPDSGINSLAGLKGHTFAFGDVNSTSGHLMPAYYLREANVDPEVLSRAIYSGGHDATALAVANKKVDAGAMDELVYTAMMRGGKITKDQVRVFYTTPPFFDYIWVARKGLDPMRSKAFAAALLKLDAARPEDAAILNLLNATKYVAAQDSSYATLRQAAQREGLLK